MPPRWPSTVTTPAAAIARTGCLVDIVKSDATSRGRRGCGDRESTVSGADDRYARSAVGDHARTCRLYADLVVCAPVDATRSRSPMFEWRQYVTEPRPPGSANPTSLSEVGRAPAMTPTADPTKDPSWRPVSMPMPAREPTPNEANALWRSGSRAFFKDQRAAQVGDIVTILVSMNDTANLKNATTTSRSSGETGSLAQFFGMQSRLPSSIPDPGKILDVGSTNNNGGSGQIQRTDAVTIRLAGVVTQVLPNGNLVVSARQEFLVNHELRELEVTGVIRPQDIASNNTVLHDRMAEARITLWRARRAHRGAAHAVGPAVDGYPAAVLR